MKIFISSILAGIMIAIGTIAFLQIQGIAGAFIFAIGLLTIVQFQLNLFTGKVNYLTSYKEIPYIFTILIGNLIGCCLMFAFPAAAASSIVAIKLTTPLWLAFIKAMLCNILIYVGIEANKNNDKITLIFAVAAFIIAGFEHSIALACFVIAAGAFSWASLIYLIIVILGNAFGGILFHQLRIKTI
jgi:formate/nitrite transporter FocA (FNT family)